MLPLNTATSSIRHLYQVGQKKRTFSRFLRNVRRDSGRSDAGWMFLNMSQLDDGVYGRIILTFVGDARLIGIWR